MTSMETDIATDEMADLVIDDLDGWKNPSDASMADCICYVRDCICYVRPEGRTVTSDLR